MTVSKLMTLFQAAAMIGALGVTSIASADDRSPDNDKTNDNNTNQYDRERTKEGNAPTTDRSRTTKTADFELAAQIRRSVAADKELSSSARNVKITVDSGIVTLKGPVKSNAEKMMVEKKASDIVGTKNVRNEMEVSSRRTE